MSLHTVALVTVVETKKRAASSKNLSGCRPRAGPPLTGAVPLGGKLGRWELERQQVTWGAPHRVDLVLQVLSRMGGLWRKQHVVWVNVGGLVAGVYLLKRTNGVFGHTPEDVYESSRGVPVAQTEESEPREGVQQD